jgi:hypothetical protein
LVDAFQIVVSLVASLAGGTGGAVVGANFALSNYRRQKVWDRKSETYSQLLRKIYELSEAYRHSAEYFDTHSEETDDDSELDRLELELGRCQRELMIEYSSSGWVLSLEVVKLFIDFNSLSAELLVEQKQESFCKIQENCYELAAAIGACARTDLDLISYDARRAGRWV